MSVSAFFLFSFLFIPSKTTHAHTHILFFGFGKEEENVALHLVRRVLPTHSSSSSFYGRSILFPFVIDDDGETNDGDITRLSCSYSLRLVRPSSSATLVASIAVPNRASHRVAHTQPQRHQRGRKKGDERQRNKKKNAMSSAKERDFPTTPCDLSSQKSFAFLLLSQHRRCVGPIKSASIHLRVSPRNRTVGAGPDRWVTACLLCIREHRHCDMGVAEEKTTILARCGQRRPPAITCKARVCVVLEREKSGVGRRQWHIETVSLYLFFFFLLPLVALSLCVPVHFGGPPSSSSPYRN